MPIIYEPRGRALEYAPLAANLYSGCTHGCTYCFAPAVLRTDRAGFHARATARQNVLVQLRRDAAKLKGDPREVLLCFITDPYQPAEKDLEITREAIRILNDEGLAVTILTKGGLLAARDFDLLAYNPRNSLAVTLTTDDPSVSRQWEPAAAPPQERMELLRQAHEAGIRTWVSFEPVFDPEACLRLLESTAPYTDFYKVGKLNYHEAAKGIDWGEFRRQIQARLTTLGKSHYIKTDLAKA